MGWRFIYGLLIAVGFSVWGMAANDVINGTTTMPGGRKVHVVVTMAHLDIFIAMIAAWVVLGCVLIFAGVYGFYLERKHPPR